jgi:hypothetical protein
MARAHPAPICWSRPDASDELVRRPNSSWQQRRPAVHRHQGESTHGNAEARHPVLMAELLAEAERMPVHVHGRQG